MSSNSSCARLVKETLKAKVRPYFIERHALAVVLTVVRMGEEHVFHFGHALVGIFRECRNRAWERTRGLGKDKSNCQVSHHISSPRAMKGTEQAIEPMEFLLADGQLIDLEAPIKLPRPLKECMSGLKYARKLLTALNIGQT